MAMSDVTEPVINAMSIDVEDYFHVSVFDGIVPRATWSDMESRVVRNTERLLDLFDEFEVRSTFFVLGWVGERHPELVRQIAQRRHEVASHGYAHRLVYDQTPAGITSDKVTVTVSAAGTPQAKRTATAIASLPGTTPKPKATATRTPTAGGGTTNTIPKTGGEFPFIGFLLGLAMLVTRQLRLRNQAASKEA